MNRSNAQGQMVADRIAAHYIPALRKPAMAPPSAPHLLQTPMYLRGSMNDWKPQDLLDMTAPGVFEVQVTLGAALHGFRIVSADGKSISWGAPFDEALATLLSLRPAPAVAP